MRRISIAFLLGFAFWSCGKSDPTDVTIQYPAVAALYQGVWFSLASETVLLSDGCKNYKSIGKSVVTECESDIAIGAQTEGSYSGSMLIRNWYDHVAGTLDGTLNSAGQMTLGVSVDGGSGRVFEDLSGCTHATGDSAFVGSVTNDTLRFHAEFSALCLGLYDSVAVVTQVEVGFVGARSAIDMETAAISLLPSTQVMQSGTSTPFTATLTDANGIMAADLVVGWSSGDTAIAKVDVLGLVSALEVGTTTITAMAAGHTATAEISVMGYSFTSVDVGDYHACGATTGGAACWGYGPFGYGLSILTPAPLSGGLAFVAVSAGGSHTCGLLADGSAYCWGANGYGQVGDGTTDTQVTPVPVAGGLKFAAVTAGHSHTCGVSTEGVTYCWGRNVLGQLGDGTRTDRSVPTPVSGPAFVAVSAGDSHSCGLLADGSAHCWGSNVSGQIGDGTTDDQVLPTAVAGGLRFTTITAGVWDSCAISADGAAYCWGSNSGRLGDGTNTSHLTPVAVTGGLRFIDISASQTHTCGISTDGAAYCWGDNSSGQLGDGSTTRALSPVRVTGGITFSSVSVGVKHTCGISTGGIVYCWGAATTGDGTGTASSIPVRVVGQL